MSKPENEKLREEFVSKELKHWSSFSSKFVRIPDSSKNEIADWWLKKIAEREAESREKLIEFINALKKPENATTVFLKMPDGEMVPIKKELQMPVALLYNSCIEDVLKLIKNKEDSK